VCDTSVCVRGGVGVEVLLSVAGIVSPEKKRYMWGGYDE